MNEQKAESEEQKECCVVIRNWALSKKVIRSENQ